MLPEVSLGSEVGMEQKVSGQLHTDHTIGTLLWVGVVKIYHL